MEPAPLHAKEESQPRVYTVSEITQDVRVVLESAFETVWIEGEISNLRVAASKHSYFVLKDDKAQIRCVMFRGHRAGLKFDPQDGDQVLLYGRFSVYQQRGEYQVIVETMEPRGLGALQKAFEQLKEKLDKEGLFDEARKKPLPEIPWKIGVVTSPTGAVIRDILNVTRRRNPKVSVLLNPVKVQGDGAAEEIARAIDEMNQRRDLDVLIVGRGGGSIEDLWAFNEEVVARAIHASKIPVISAVGHEIDFTIADFVADVRAPTPSAAAEIAVPRLDDLEGRLRELRVELESAMRDSVTGYRETLRRLMDRRFFHQPRQILETPGQRLDDLTQRLARALEQWRVLQKARLRDRIERLFQAAPKNKIQRQRLGDLTHRLARGLDQWRVVQKARLRVGTERLLQATPANEISRLGEAEEKLHRRLTGAALRQLHLKTAAFEGRMKNLNAVNPLSILERGYSVCSSEKTGQAVKSNEEIREGDAVKIRLSKGKLDCTVNKTYNDSE